MFLNLYCSTYSIIKYLSISGYLISNATNQIFIFTAAPMQPGPLRSSALSCLVTAAEQAGRFLLTS